MAISFALFATLLQEFGHQRGPTRLMTGADASAVIAVEVFVKQDQIAPMRIVLKRFRPAVDWPAAVGIPKEDTG
jgi:hypothetical protein